MTAAVTPMLTGKVALVMGSGSDVGRAVGEALTGAGATVVDEPGGVDILVTLGCLSRPTTLDGPREQALADFDELFAANVGMPFLVQRAVVTPMIERGGGDIVNITTADVLPPLDGDTTNSPLTDVVNASRWAVNGFTQAWALGLRKHRIRVNALATTGDDHGALGRSLLALLAEGPDGRTGETIRVSPTDPDRLPSRRQRGEEIL